MAPSPRLRLIRRRKISLNGSRPNTRPFPEDQPNRLVGLSAACERVGEKLSEHAFGWMAGAITAALALVAGAFWQVVEPTYADLRYRGEMADVKSYMRQGHAAFNDGDVHLGHVRYAQAAALLKSMGGRGYSAAFYELGRLTCVGFGVPKDFELAKFYFQRAKLDDAKRERLLQVPDFAGCIPTQTASLNK